MSIINLNINGYEVKGRDNQTILDIASENGIIIPTLCHDERVKAYGACGVCVVEAEGVPRLLRACSTIASDGMVIKTNTERVRASRKTALELMLSDHVGDCRPPCVLACPAQTDCQGYVGLIANKQHKEALMLIKDKIPLPSSIGRVCPHPCQTACRRELVEDPIDIVHLKQFAGDIDLFGEDGYKPEIGEESGKNVTVIGGGPGGLAAAYYLRKKGHGVVIYDSMLKMGGMLVYGIPEYRLPKAIVEKEVKTIEDMGVKFVNGVKIGRDLTLDDIKNKFDAVIVAIGAWSSISLNCPGEGFNGVTGGIDFLRDIESNRNIKGKKVAVVGGGNTAMDACRTAVRLGADSVYNIYRRTKKEMPAEPIEIKEAEEEGVIFKNLTNPIEILGENNCVTGIRLQIMELGEPDASGRRSPVAVEGEEETLDVDMVIIAIGQRVDATGFEGITLTKRKTLAADESTFRTNIDNVFAIGDATNRGADIAISAIGEAKKAAEIIDAYLNGACISYVEPYLVKGDDVTPEFFADRAVEHMVPMRHLPAEERKNNFNEVNKGFSEEEAVREAMRCLECGCRDYFECKLIAEANNYEVKPEKFAGEAHNRDFKDDHPFILKNPDKCILCGLCVRICDETMGITALGFVDRGFDTIVQPALGLPLNESGCISCGQCVHACPTGALVEVTGACKQTPVKEDFINTVCSYCSLGCGTKVSVKGDMLLRSLPDTDTDKTALLCAKGRFGMINPLLKECKKIAKPLVRKNGELAEADFKDGYLYINEKLREISDKYGKNSIAVSVSDQFINEDISAIKKYASEILGIENIISFNLSESVFNFSTASMDDLHSYELIFAIERDMLKSHTVCAVRIKQCVDSGCKLITLNNSDTYLDEFSACSLESGEDLDVLKQFAKALIALGRTPENKDGFDEFKHSLEGVVVHENVKRAAEEYAKAESVSIVFEHPALSVEAQRFIELIYHLRSTKTGIIQLRQNANSQGLYNIGADTPDGRDIKALLSFGEDITESNLAGLEFLAVAGGYLTETAEKADVVLPFADILHSDGTITNTFGETKKAVKVLEPESGISNIDIIKGLAEASGKDIKWSGKIPSANKNGVDNNYKTLITEGAKFYREHRNTYWKYNKFMQFMNEEM